MCTRRKTPVSAEQEPLWRNDDAPFLALLVLICVSSEALAAKCTTITKMTSILGLRFEEAVVGEGTSADAKAVIQMWRSKKGSWTLTVTYGNGTSCIVAAGKNWEVIDPRPIKGPPA